MAPFGNFLFSGLVEQSAKESNLTVVYTAEQSSWVGIPPALAGKLLDKMPLTLRLQLFAAHAVPVGSPYYLAWSGTVSESGKLSLSSQLGRLLPLPEGATVRIESRPAAGSLIHSFTHSLIHSFTHSLIRPFVRSFSVRWWSRRWSLGRCSLRRG